MVDLFDIAAESAIWPWIDGPGDAAELNYDVDEIPLEDDSYGDLEGDWIPIEEDLLEV